VARIYIERQDLPEDVRKLFDALWGEDDLQRTGGAEYSPPLDIVETDDSVDVLVDLPGVACDDVQVIVTRGVVLIAGQKRPAACEHHDATFHLAERTFGRFARAVRVDGAFDGANATATLQGGELRIALPRTTDRRGRQIRIPVRA
jgi:HSP20 family protein